MSDLKWAVAKLSFGDLVVVSLLTLVLLPIGSGCGVWRGIPTHGGGKRFDEEQRAVASAIRRTLADMDLSELEGKRVQVVVESLAQDGGGVVSFPGLSNISGGVNASEGDGIVSQILPAVPGGPSWINTNNSSNVSGNVGIGWQGSVNYGTHSTGTSADLNYLRASLDMKLRHCRITPVPAGEVDAVLYVLVDVLGTNRSRRDHILSNSDTLQASVECTYYAHDPRDNTLLFEARRASSAAVYAETHRLGVAGVEIHRSIERTMPTDLPVDEPNKPTTQPTVVAKKKGLTDAFRWLAGAE